jgi:hypothetical protein
MAEISILLKKEIIFFYGKYPVGFTKFKVQRVVNLFEDTGSYVNSITLLKYKDHVLVLYERIKASSIISRSRLTQFFFFFLAYETSFKDEFLLPAFFIDDQFFDINLK